MQIKRTLNTVGVRDIWSFDPTCLPLTVYLMAFGASPESRTCLAELWPNAQLPVLADAAGSCMTCVKAWQLATSSCLPALLLRSFLYDIYLTTKFAHHIDAHVAVVGSDQIGETSCRPVI